MASTVTPHTDMDPSPRVDVFIDDADLDPDTTEITVHQISPAGDIQVRNMIRQTSLGGFADTDYEPPFGVPITYRVAQYDVDGVELGFVLELSTQVDFDSVVLSDPLAPGVAVAVNALADFGGELKRERPTRTYRAGFRTVALMGIQSLLDNVSLHCETDSLNDADMLEDVLASGQFLVRIPPSTSRLPLLLNVVVPAPVQVPIDVQFGGEIVEWKMDATEVSRPEIDIIVPVINYQRFIDYVFATGDGTYGYAATLWSTYLDALLNVPPEV